MLQARRLFNTIFTAIFSRNKAKMITRIILIVVAATTLFTAVMVAFASCNIRNAGSPSLTQSPQIGLQVGDRASDFTLTNLSGDEVSLRDFRGKPTMLNFWYSSCSDCRDESPTIQQYYTSAPAMSKHFAIRAVNTLGGDDEQTVQNFVQQNHLTYPIVMDEQQRVATLYHVRETPTSYFLDPKGIIQSVVIGPVTISFLNLVLAAPKKASGTTKVR